VIDVAGRLQADVRIVGAATDPHPEGTITIADGAFMLVPTGVKYLNLNGRLELHEDRVQIDNLRLQDDDHHELELSGDLAIHERQLGGVNVAVKSDDFHVLRNKMGIVEVDTDIRIAGELTRPRLEGELGIVSGRLELDRIFAAAGASPYSVKPTEYAESTNAANASTNEAKSVASNDATSVSSSTATDDSSQEAQPPAPRLLDRL